MPPLFSDPHQARQRGPSAAGVASRDPRLPWQSGKAATGYRKQVAKRKGQSPTPTAAQPGPQPAGEEGTHPRADQDHCRARGEGQEDTGTEEQEGGR